MAKLLQEVIILFATEQELVEDFIEILRESDPWVAEGLILIFN